MTFFFFFIDYNYFVEIDGDQKKNEEWATRTTHLQTVMRCNNAAFKLFIWINKNFCQPIKEHVNYSVYLKKKKKGPNLKIHVFLLDSDNPVFVFYIPVCWFHFDFLSFVDGSFVLGTCWRDLGPLLLTLNTFYNFDNCNLN